MNLFARRPLPLPLRALRSALRPLPGPGRPHPRHSSRFCNRQSAIGNRQFPGAPGPHPPAFWLPGGANPAQSGRRPLDARPSTIGQSCAACGYLRLFAAICGYLRSIFLFLKTSVHYSSISPLPAGVLCPPFARTPKRHARSDAPHLEVRKVTGKRFNRGGLFRWRSDRVAQPGRSRSALCGSKAGDGKRRGYPRSPSGSCRRGVEFRRGRLRRIGDEDVW